MDNKSARSSGTCGSMAFDKCTRRGGTKQHEAIECDLVNDAGLDGLGFEFQRNDSAAQSWPTV